MKYQDQLKLQAFLDGELPEAESREVANTLGKDPEAKALHTELQQTHQALTGFEAGIKLAEPAAFYWSKIEREIERLERAAREPVAEPWFAQLRRYLMPAAGAALAVLASVAILRGPGSGQGVETTLADAGAFTYRDASAGATLVWLSYPADEDVAADEESPILD